MLFVTSLSDYNSVLFEDERINSMLESVNLYEKIVNSKYFSKKPIILILNKNDIFREKLEKDKIPLSTCFSKNGHWPKENEYFMDENNNNNSNSLIHFDTEDMFEDYYTKCITFIQTIFHNRDKNANLRVTYDHITTATDNAIVEKVFGDVQNMLARLHLFRGGFIPNTSSPRLPHAGNKNEVNDTKDVEQALQDVVDKNVNNVAIKPQPVVKPSREATATDTNYSNFTLNAPNQRIYDLIGNQLIIPENYQFNYNHNFNQQMVDVKQDLNHESENKNQSVMNSLTNQRYVPVSICMFVIMITLYNKIIIK